MIYNHILQLYQRFMWYRRAQLSYLQVSGRWLLAAGGLRGKQQGARGQLPVA